MPFGTQPDPRYAFPSSEHQIAVAKMRYAADQRRGLALLMGPVGAGKCLAKGTPVLMFDGSVRPVEEVRLGDRLMGPDSRPRTVLSLAHGWDQMYRVIPVTGEAYVVNEPHILSLKETGGQGRHQGRVVNLSVAEYLARSNDFRRNVKGYRVGVDFPAQAVRLEPYFLGLWLGDGAASGPRIHTTDVPVVDYLEEYAGRAGVTLRRVVIKGDKCPAYDLTTGREMGAKSGHAYGWGRNPIRTALQEYGRLGDKRIPLCYLANSRETRLELLAGLIDTDGCLVRNCYEIVAKSEALADDIAFLARSLGFAAYKKPSRKICTNNGVCRVYYRVMISGEVSLIPVRIPRKRAQPRRQPKDVLLTGVTVEPQGLGEYFGFEIDGDGLFLLGDFTVTHNTTIANQLQKTWSEDREKTVAFLPSASVRTPSQFLRLALEGFGLVPVRLAQDNQRLLQRFLLDEFEAGRHPVLLIDEAQNIHPDNIDVLSDLSNFQTAQDKLVTIVLLAQDNFPNKLARKEAFRSRIAVVSNLDPLTFEDMAGMIAHRLAQAGGGDIGKYFEPEALNVVYNTTMGIPRDVCTLCDTAFVNAFVAGSRRITAGLVDQAAREMGTAKGWPVRLAAEK